ncbi:MAG: nitrogenase cofactor biosynthesis protein NifB [Desulfarculus sp.]|nr:nitrogenase cofactor biosynthesis protein NifB [Desulfarculus sp.]
MSANPHANLHPCFNAEVKGSCGRVHLPVAPLCNLRCNYCNRKYDCANESRPGVTSGLLTPHQAVEYLARVLEQEPRITVAGIAGPGDPLANPQATLQTLRLVRQRFPELLICLSSNGLALPDHLEEVAALASHVTLTINAVDPEVGARIYAWARQGKVVYRGRAAAELLLERQMTALAGLKERGVMVKVNTIIIPGVNDQHVAQVAARVSGLGADLHNLMPLYPNTDTPFAEVPEPGAQQMDALRQICAGHLPQMSHCTRCRADAVGLLGQDRSPQMRGCLTSCGQLPEPAPEGRPYVAVASREGVLVNLHLGQAERFQIWGPTPDGYALIEERQAPAPGGGVDRWYRLAELLKDCRAVLVSGIGETPRLALEESGVTTLEMEGFIEQGLRTVYEGLDASLLRVRKLKPCQGGAGGSCH